MRWLALLLVACGGATDGPCGPGESPITELELECGWHVVSSYTVPVESECYITAPAPGTALAPEGNAACAIGSTATDTGYDVPRTFRAGDRLRLWVNLGFDGEVALPIVAPTECP